MPTHMHMFFVCHSYVSHAESPHHSSLLLKRVGVVVYSMRDSQRSADPTKSIPRTHRNVTLITKKLRYDDENDKYDAYADDF